MTELNEPKINSPWRINLSRIGIFYTIIADDKLDIISSSVYHVPKSDKKLLISCILNVNFYIKFGHVIRKCGDIIYNWQSEEV